MDATSEAIARFAIDPETPCPSGPEHHHRYRWRQDPFGDDEQYNIVCCFCMDVATASVIWAVPAE